MTESIEKVTSIYNGIRDYFENGKLARIVLDEIRKQYKEKPNKPDDIFITTLVISTYNTVILSLANTIKPNDDSINLQYLLNCIKNSKGILSNEKRQLFNKFNDELESALKIIEPTTQRIIEFRDKAVAHVDRAHINNPSFLLQKPPISWDDVETAYRIVDSALLEIGEYIGATKQGQEFIGLAYLELIKKTWKVLHLFYSNQ